VEHINNHDSVSSPISDNKDSLTICEWLNSHDIEHIVRSNTHYQILFGGEKVDLWPTKAKWKGKSGSGTDLNSLAKYIYIKPMLQTSI
jgi:hypothetical protein